MINIVNGVGTIRYDPSRYTGIIRKMFITYNMSENLFIENGIFRKIITAPADEALRAGFCIKTSDDIDVSEAENKILSLYEDLACEEKFATALYWHRCYGGAVIFPVFKDLSEDLTKPLDENNIYGIEEIRVYSAKEVIPLKQNEDFNSTNYKKTETYLISDEATGAYFEIHYSRLIIFNGLTVPNILRNERNGWGGMVLENIYDTLILKYDLGNKFAIDIMERMAQGILKIAGLLNKLSIEGGEDEVRTYLQNIDMVRNILNTLAIDKDDDYDIKSISLSGVKDILDKTQTMLSAVSEIPVTILFGRSPGGQNATGDSDFEQYYSMVQKLQRRDLKPQLSKFIYFLSKCKDYQIKLPDTWSLKFNPLSIPTEKEQAETDKMKAETKEKNISALTSLVNIGGLDNVELRNYLEEQGFKLDRTLDNVGRDVIE